MSSRFRECQQRSAARLQVISGFKRRAKQALSPLLGAKATSLRSSKTAAHKSVAFSAGRKGKRVPGTPSDSQDDAEMTGD